MYSSYYTPKDRQSDILTDHEALHRDVETHRSIQSDESVLRPIDLETIMSSKGVVKYWYLHRPKTMDYVHKNVTKIQSLGRAFAVRQLKKKYGAEYVVALAKADASKREADKLAELSAQERDEAEKANAEYEARVEESRRLRREQMEAEAAAEALLRAQQADEERIRKEAEEEARRQEEEKRLAAIAAAEALRREEEAAAEALRLEEEAAAEALRLEEEAEAQAAREYAAKQKEADEEAARVAAIDLARQEAEEAAQRERELKGAALAAAAAIAQRAKEDKLAAEQAKIEAEKNELYEQSLSKDVPVVVRNHGPGRVVSYDKEDASYTVRMEAAMGGLTITVKGTEVDLDDDRILSPRTKVDTPFGTGEVIGLDPHVGCYAINTEINAPDGEQSLAFVQIGDVTVHVEEKEERAIVENTAIPIPDEINLLSARIVDSRVVNRTGKKFIQFKLEIKTSNYGTVYCWKRYSTFRSLCERLQKDAGYSRKEIPELPKRQIMGNFSQKTIGERAEKLNLF